MKRVELILENLNYPLFNPEVSDLELDARDLLNWAASEYPTHQALRFEVYVYECGLLARNVADEAKLNSFINS